MFGLIPLLIARGMLPWVASLVVYGIATAIGVSAVAYFWHAKVAEPYRVQGDNRTKAKLVPQIAALQKKLEGTLAELKQTKDDLKLALDANTMLTRDVDKLGLEASASAATITRLQQLAEQARATARRLLAEIAERSKQDAAEIERLKTAATAAPLDFAKACEEADQVLARLSVWVRS